MAQVTPPSIAARLKALEDLHRSAKQVFLEHGGIMVGGDGAIDELASIRAEVERLAGEMRERRIEWPEGATAPTPIQSCEVKVWASALCGEKED